jgi:hypothetical protein
MYDLDTDPAEREPIPPTGKTGAGPERRLLSLLPPRAAGYELVPSPPLALQMGQILERAAGGGR